MHKGVLYIISADNDIIDECVYSAASLKKHNPNLQVQVITNALSPKFDTRYFDFVDVHPEPYHPLKAKVRFLNESRFKTTLFLDADTEVRASIEHLFTDKNFNLSFTYDNLCDWRANPVKFLAQQSNDINTGFLLYDSSAVLREHFSRWYQLVSTQDETDMRPGHNCDQVYFNRYLRQSLLEDTRIKVRILPNDIYNVRPWCWPQLKQNGKFQETKVLHAHHLHHTLLTKAGRKIRSILST
jgi:hypothetical protein